MKITTVRSKEKSRIHSSVATLEVRIKWKRSGNKLSLLQKDYNRSDFGVTSDHAHGRRHHPTY